MLFADPLSRVCGPTEGWHDPSIPCKIATLLKHLPESIRETPKIRLIAGKDTSGASKILYQWRKTKNLLASSIMQRKLSTSGDSSVAFHIGIEDAVIPYDKKTRMEIECKLIRIVNSELRLKGAKDKPSRQMDGLQEQRVFACSSVLMLSIIG